RGARLLAGYRGARPVDLDSVADLIVRVSRLPELEPGLLELDLNPVVVWDGGLAAVDARILWDPERAVSRQLSADDEACTAEPTSPPGDHPPMNPTRSAPLPPELQSAPPTPLPQAWGRGGGRGPLSADPAVARLLNPRSIAVVGASDDRRKQGGRLFHYLLKHGFPGRLYPVNPRATEVMGRPCFPSVEALPEAPDLAGIMVPGEAVPGVVDECGRKGVAAAIVHASGFAETGEAGRQLQAQMVEPARRHGLRLCGPNTAGAVNVGR